jgi:hypothetical protein
MTVFSSVVTLANSIIGVSILAMPYCFKQVRPSCLLYMDSRWRFFAPGFFLHRSAY